MIADIGASVARFGSVQFSTVNVLAKPQRPGGTDNRNQECGLCRLVTRIFNRVICGAPSRRGSGDSYQEVAAVIDEEIVSSSHLFLKV